MATDVQEILRYRDSEIAAIERNAEWTQDAKEAKKRAVRELAQREYEEAKAQEKLRLENNFAAAKEKVFRVPRGYGSSDAEEAQIQVAFDSFWRGVVSDTEGLEEEGSGGFNRSVQHARFSVLSRPEVRKWRGWVVLEGCRRRARKSCGSGGGPGSP